MPSGYEVGGADLDSIFAAFHSGWPQASAVGYAVSGGNLNARYAALSAGSAAAATGYKQGGADLNAIFAAAGSTAVQVGTQPINVTGIRAAGYPSGTVVSALASCAGVKGGGTYTYTWHTVGCTANSPNISSTTFFATVNAASTDIATAFCEISDGVTSINTSVISVTLQNSSPAVLPVSIAGGPAQAFGLGPATLTTNSVTASASAGVAPFTFAWTFQSGGVGLTATNPSGASTAWSGHIIPGASLVGVALCTVTDSVGTQGTATVNVNITATN